MKTAKMIVVFSVLMGLAAAMHAQTIEMHHWLYNSTDCRLSKTLHDEVDKLSDCVPSAILQMIQWPDADVLKGPKSLPDDSTEVLFAKKQVEYWAQIVLAKSWMAPEDAPRFFIKDEFDEIDMVRQKWQHDGFNVEMSQAGLVFVLKVTPAGGRNTGNDDKSKLKFARDLALKIFDSKLAYRLCDWEPDQGPGREYIPDIAQRIVSASFDSATTVKVGDTGIIAGRPKTMAEEGLPKTVDAQQVLEARKKGSKTWDKFPESWSYWFRRVHWHNDGKSVTFYFMKIAGPGQWMDHLGNALNISKRFFKDIDANRQRKGK